MPDIDPDQLIPSIKVYPRDLTPYAMVVGDPNRVRDVAALMSDVKEIGNNREYLTVTGIYAGQRLVVASHGVGAAGANLCFMELLHGGVRLLIRAGTCGAMVTEIADGNFIIATASVREDAATEQLMPLPYPAVADYQVVNALIEASRRNGIKKPHIGLTISVANFYSTPIVPPIWQKYINYGVLGVEMELAALLVVAQMHGARAGGILVSDGQAIEPGATYDPYREVVARGKKIMLKIALDALSELARAEDAVAASS